MAAKKKSAAAPALDINAIVAAAVAQALASANVAPAGTVATAVVAEPPAKPSASKGSYNAEGWDGKGGELCITVRRGSGRGITFLTAAQVAELESPVISGLVASVEKAAGRKLGAKRK
jgi:hypothetical protein